MAAITVTGEEAVEALRAIRLSELVQQANADPQHDQSKGLSLLEYDSVFRDLRRRVEMLEQFVEVHNEAELARLKSHL